MISQSREILALRSLTPDGRLLFATRMARMFAYGFLSVVLALYLAQRGLNDNEIGLLLTWTLVGDAAVSLLMTLIADRLGRRWMLMIGAGLMIFAGLTLAFTDSLPLLVIAAVIGTLSPSGNEVGAFLSIEQAALSQATPDQHRTSVFAWYNLVGSFSTALGALTTGALATFLIQSGQTPLASYRVIIGLYALLGAILLVLFIRLSAQSEAPRRDAIASSPLNPSHRDFRWSLPTSWRGDFKTSPDTTENRKGMWRGTFLSQEASRRFGLGPSRGVVFGLSGLFMIDAFAGGLVLQSLIAYWFHARFGVEIGLIGGIFFAANILAGLSAIAAGRIAAKIGLINTMVWTHIPSNILLMLVPLMPNAPLAILVLLARFSISQMDVPTRQSYIMAVVQPDERSAAAGVTTIARTAASAIAPTLTGRLFSAGLLNAPFFIAGGLKIVYDLLLYRRFRAVKPPEER
jgi:MFS family permease